MQKGRRTAYLAILVGFGLAALLHVLVDIVSHALAAVGIMPPWAFQVASIPFVRDFDDPAGRILRLLTPEPHFRSLGYSEPWARTFYTQWHGATFAATLILVLCVRRWRACRGDFTRLPPPSFHGFAFGIACVGLASMILGWLDAWRLTFPVDPMNAGAMIAFVAFLTTELWPGSTLGAVAAGSPAAMPALEGAPRPRRRPIWTTLGLVLPAAIGLTAWFLADKTPGLAAVAVLLVGVVAGLGLGAIATVVAIVRRERWIPLQVLDALVNFGIGLPLLATFLSPGIMRFAWGE